MTTFQEARAFLLKHRTDYDAAVKGFRWPEAAAFNWALDWFDADLARDPASRDRTALWIVDAGQNRVKKMNTNADQQSPKRCHTKPFDRWTSMLWKLLARTLQTGEPAGWHALAAAYAWCK